MLLFGRDINVAVKTFVAIVEEANIRSDIPIRQVTPNRIGLMRVLVVGQTEKFQKR